MNAALAALTFYAHFVPFFFAGPPPDYQCGDGPGFRYCVYDPPYGVIEDPDSVVYFLHYGSGDEKSWRRVPISRVFYAEYRRRGLLAPKVISLSYGPYWRFVASVGGKTPSPMVSDFFNDALPWLDSKFGVPKRRFLWGMSQGGLSAATILLSKPELWSAVVLTCPALYSIDLFSAKEKVAVFAQANGLSLGKVEWGMALINNRVRSAEDWKREDPLLWASRASLKKFPPLYVEANRSDDFGFNFGARAFAAALSRAGRAADYREIPGGHCEVDAWAESRFLADQERNAR